MMVMVSASILAGFRFVSGSPRDRFCRTSGLAHTSESVNHDRDYLGMTTVSCSQPVVPYSRLVIDARLYDPRTVFATEEF